MKKTRSLLALLACLALLVSLTAVTASAATTTVSSSFDFRNTDKIAAGSGGSLSGDQAKAEIESMGLIIPEDSGAWMLNDCYHVFATPVDGYSTCKLIQTLDLGDKVLLEDATLTAGFWLAVVGDPSWFWIEVSTDGENWSEVYVNEEGIGEEWQASAYAEGTIPLPGTAGASKVYVRYNVERHSGPTSGGLTFGTINAVVEGEAEALPDNEVASNCDFTTLTPTAGGAESNAVLESMGIIVPEGSEWQIVDHFSVCIIPKDGYQKTYYIQTLDAGEGKVLAEDATMNLSYALAAQCDDVGYTVGWVVVYVSTDGENFTEVWCDDEGQGKMYDASAFADEQIALTGTAGASKVWVKVELERHAGETSGLIKSSTLSAVTKAGETVTPDPENPKDGDSIAVIAALALVCAAGAVITAKKFRKEN